jgi:sugar/nucleoside kinase (ribokinase family)
MSVLLIAVEVNMAKYDVFGVGNALVDTVVFIDEVFLSENKIQKGIMTLVGSSEQNEILKKLSGYKKQLRSGGSAANTMIALANSGGTGYYAGKVSSDENGNFYKKDMEDAGIEFSTVPSKEGYTGTCLVLTTKDADRTMITHLGISTALCASDIDINKLKQASISYTEGYLWGGDDTRKASVVTLENSKKYGIKVAYTYSDPFCVNGSRDQFIQLTKEYVDYIFCNTDEAKALSQREDKLAALDFIGNLCDTVFMTDGANGAYYFHEGSFEHVEGFKATAIDTVGAGDCFAAGVLFGLTHNLSLTQSVKWGNYMASKIVQEPGARLSFSLKDAYKKVVG